MRQIIHKFTTSRRSKRVALVSLVAALSFFGSVANSQTDHYDQLPDLGSQAANYLSDVEATKLGEAFIRQSRYRFNYVSDPELVDYINRVGNKLLAVSDAAGKKYHFYLIDNDVINAFAVPGGHIAIHTGILTKSESESELASVVGHEIAHVTQRHIARKLETSKYDSIIALGALLAAAAAGGSDAAQAAFGLANASIIERKLSYSRAFEAEADSLGIRLLSRAGYDPNAMPRFFKRLHDVSRINESHAPEFLRSHPLTINRIAESAERVRAYPPPAKPVDNSEFLLMQAKAKAGYGDDKAIVRDYYLDKINKGKKTLANQYGYALALSENGEYKKARQAFAKLLKEHPKNVTVRMSNAENELYDRKVAEGLKLYKELYEEQIALDNHLVDVYYANALVINKQHDKAKPILRAAIANDKTEPLYHILLSRAYGETGDNLNAYRERGEYHYLRGNYGFAVEQFERARTYTESSYELARLEARIVDLTGEIEELEKLK